MARGGRRVGARGVRREGVKSYSSSRVQPTRAWQVRANGKRGGRGDGRREGATDDARASLSSHRVIRSLCAAIAFLSQHVFSRIANPRLSEQAQARRKEDKSVSTFQPPTVLEPR